MISKLKRWSINYYNETAQAGGQAAKDLQRANGGLGEYYSEHETRTPVWLVAGDKVAGAQLVGLRVAARSTDFDLFEAELRPSVQPLVLGFVDVAADERLYVGGAINAG